MAGLFGERVLQCSDGHLFTSSQSTRTFGSIHFGPMRLMRCPVDGRMKMMSNINADSLSPQELDEARRHRI